MTDTTLAERLARCVKPLEWELHADDDGPRYRAFCPVLMCVHCADDEAICDSIDATRTARILAALDIDALAREVEAMVGQEKRIEELTAALKEVTLHRDQLLEVSDRLFDDVAALFARQIELQDAIENAARMAEQGILSMDGRLAASEIRSLAPSEIRSLAPRSSTPVDPVAEAAKVLLADLRNREGGKP
jgi:hypothetical protein